MLLLLLLVLLLGIGVCGLLPTIRNWLLAWHHHISVVNLTLDP